MKAPVSIAVALAIASAAYAQHRIVTSFHATVEERQAHFEWTVSPEREDEEISCTIDVDADDPGNVDEFVPNCGETTTYDHTYEEPGRYRAALTATSNAGGSDRAIVTVVVRPNAAS